MLQWTQTNTQIFLLTMSSNKSEQVLNKLQLVFNDKRQRVLKKLRLMFYGKQHVAEAETQGNQPISSAVQTSTRVWSQLCGDNAVLNRMTSEDDLAGEPLEAKRRGNDMYELAPFTLSPMPPNMSPKRSVGTPWNPPVSSWSKPADPALWVKQDLIKLANVNRYGWRCDTFEL